MTLPFCRYTGKQTFSRAKLRCTCGHEQEQGKQDLIYGGLWPMTPSRAVTFIDERLIKRWSAQEAVAPTLSLNAFLRGVAAEGRDFGGSGSMQVSTLLGLGLFSCEVGVACNTNTHAGSLCLCMAHSS